MKKTVVFISLILSVSVAFGQKKSKEDPKDVQIDSLKKASTTLAVQLDSVSKELVKYVGVYNAIKENILHYSFDPTRAAYLIDSLKASRDSTTAKLLAQPKSTALSDSLAMLVKENKTLKDSLDVTNKSLAQKNAIPDAEVEKAKTIGNLKQLKELYDAKIISEAEFVALKKKYLDKL
jgi:hypothetical protein